MRFGLWKLREALWTLVGVWVAPCVCGSGSDPFPLGAFPSAARAPSACTLGTCPEGSERPEGWAKARVLSSRKCRCGRSPVNIKLSRPPVVPCPRCSLHDLWMSLQARFLRLPLLSFQQPPGGLRGRTSSPTSSRPPGALSSPGLATALGARTEGTGSCCHRAGSRAGRPDAPRGCPTSAAPQVKD